MNEAWNRSGAIAVALLSAALFGAATPASKLLLADFSPFQLAGLLYLGAALAVLPTIVQRGWPRLPEDATNRRRLFGAVLFGGVVAPVLLLLGLRAADASSVALWLNFELAATALLGVALFREHIGALGWGGVLVAIAGASVLSLPHGTAGIAAGGLVLLACICWGLDNHFTALIDGLTPSQSTFWKGLVAGTTNVTIGVWLNPLEVSATTIAAALVVGAFAYGISIALYISAAQSLGATRAQIVFAAAPFFGVLLSVSVLGEPLTTMHVISGALFAAGIALFTMERHTHEHVHEAVEHEHAHRHDDAHHDHEHANGLTDTSGWHTHRHNHARVVHQHPHWPDLHHRHRHGYGGVER